MDGPLRRSIGGFRIVRELKGGSQGTVYRAVCECDDFRDCPRGTVVALKTMFVEDETHELFLRLQRRTEQLEGLRHRNIVRYLGCFHVQEPFAEMHVIVQEFLDGETLKERLERQPGGLDADEALRVTVAMVSALAAAETRGICHRDVKPGNIFLCRNGDIKMIDFEVAHVGEATSTSGDGRLIGTFDYMAPDFTDPGFRGDVCSDVFSAGVVMHEALTGRTPYREPGGGAQADFVFMSRWTRQPDGTFSSAPIQIATKVKRLLAHVDTVLAAALAPNRALRFPNFAAFVDALRGVRFRDLLNGGRAYRILQLVGKGGFGEVFKARDKATGRLVAVKHLIKAECAVRFKREAKIMAQLDDPCFVRFVDFFIVEHSGGREAFLLMNFLDGMPGSSLKDAIRRARGEGLPRRNVLRAFARFAHGLRVLHARGIYHRDIKPANLYYPEDDPGRCAIMDFGIARDVNGTATTGGVPGTFDYMPPEVVTQKDRGESGMDIYALGLCLYEALTGRTAYPKLPAGTAAYGKFFQRAKSLERPDLGALGMAADIDLLKLVREMTEPDVRLRLTNTAALEARLWDLADEENPYAAAIENDETRDATTVSQAATETLPSRPEPRRVPAKPVKPVRGVKPGTPPASGGFRIAASLVVVLCAAVFFGRSHIQRGILSVVESVERSRREKAERRLVELRHEKDRKLEQARRAADFALSRYDEEDTSVEEADAAIRAWCAEWAETVGEGEIARVEGERKERRGGRVSREAARARAQADDERRSREAQAVRDAYEKDGIEEGDRYRDAWVKKWGKSSAERVGACLASFDRSKETRKKADREAVDYAAAAKASAEVGKSYRDESLEIADCKRDIWASEWRTRLTKAHYDLLVAKLDEIRVKCKGRQDESDRRDAELRLVRECEEICAAVDPVELRRNRLDDADRMLTSGIDAGIVREPNASRLRKMVHDRRNWTVFRVANRMSGALSVGSVSVPRGQTRLFAYTNDVPAGLAIVCPGYEPISLGRSDDGRTIRVSREILTAKPVIVTVPDLEPGVVCRIDNVVVSGSTAGVRPGSHVGTYSRPNSRDQTFFFTVECGTPLRLQEPGVWQVSEALKERNQQAKLQHESDELARTCRGLMAAEPFRTRRARLAACDAKLREWNADALLGTDLMAELKEELRVQRQRVIGVVSNGTDHVVRIGGTPDALPIAPKSGAVINFPNGLPENASLQVRGYEPVELPADFDGTVFFFTEDLLVDSPVRVTLPELPEGVTCLIDGEVAVAMRELKPGVHTYVYRKGDCADIRAEFSVTNNVPMTLPAPAGWRESTALANLKSAWAALNDGTVAEVDRFLEAAEVQSDENMRRKRELQRQVALRKRYVALKDEAARCMDDELWADALRLYAELKKLGYVFTAEELERCRSVSDKARERSRQQRAAALAAGKAQEVGKADEELRLLHAQYDVIVGKGGL